MKFETEKRLALTNPGYSLDVAGYWQPVENAQQREEMDIMDFNFTKMLTERMKLEQLKKKVDEIARVDKSFKQELDRLLEQVTQFTVKIFLYRELNFICILFINYMAST